jgi:hypothetical protein
MTRPQTAEWELRQVLENSMHRYLVLNVFGKRDSLVTVLDRGSQCVGERWVCLTCLRNSCEHIAFASAHVESGTAQPKVAA